MKTKSKSAFTCLELIVVIAVFLMVFALVALPALARSKTRSPAAGCLSNLRQLMVAWQMYAEENGGAFMLNAPVGTATAKGWCPSSTGWGNVNANTNVSSLLSSQMGRYFSNNISVFRCPGDVIPSTNGYRLRSYSMNGQLGPQSSPGFQNYGAPLRTYSQLADLGCPNLSSLFVFCDESPCTMDDGYFQVSYTPYFPNLPAAYLDGGGGFSFADGHGEIHKWQGTNLLVPLVYGKTSGLGGPHVAANDPDWLWFGPKAGCK
jgi:hypothetical protein